MGVEIQHHVHYAPYDQSDIRKILTANYLLGQRQMNVLEGRLQEFFTGQLL